MIYTRLRKHYQFVNELMLFPDIGHPVTFSVNVYGSERSLDEVHLISINDLFIPSTIKACRILKAEEERGKFFLEMEEGRRTEDGKWNTVGHPHRVIEITNRQLKTIASVFNDFPSAPKLPSFFNSTLLAIAEKFGESDHRVSDVGSNNMVISSMWHESGAKKDGYIKALPGNETVFPDATWKVILNGPHIFVGNPVFKTPQIKCPNPHTWDLIDLNSISNDYLPRVKYLPGVDEEGYKAAIQNVPWNEEESYADFYRLIYRRMVGSDSERSLIPAIIPPEFAYVHMIQGIAFRRSSDMLNVASIFSSLPGDFYIRIQKKNDLMPTLMKGMPLLEFTKNQRRSLHARILSLNCLTTYYKDLWEECWKEGYQDETWSVSQEGIDENFFSSLTKDWCRTNALRSDLMRRQALLEIDVIVAQALGFTLEELKTMYNFGFRVMKSYDRDTYYDRNGRIVFTSNSMDCPAPACL